MKLGGRIDISIVFLCIVRILSLLLMIPHDSYFVQVSSGDPGRRTDSSSCLISISGEANRGPPRMLWVGAW